VAAIVADRLRAVGWCKGNCLRVALRADELDPLEGVCEIAQVEVWQILVGEAFVALHRLARQRAAVDGLVAGGALHGVAQLDDRREALKGGGGG